MGGPGGAWRRRLLTLRARTVTLWVALVFVQVSLVLIYLLSTPDRVTSVRHAVVYPLVWINVALWTTVYARPVSASGRHRLVAAAVGAGYFLLLLAIPGRIALAGDVSDPSGVTLRMLIPGWGPILSVETTVIRATLVPYETAGYAAIAYLVSLNLLRLSRSSLAGLFGVVTCVGCTVPVVVPLLGALGGAGSAVAAVTVSWFYDLSTVVFLLAVAVLYRGHRPGP